MGADLSVVFTGIRFENPFLLSSAPPTESESNILRAFEAGWGGVVTKTIGLHPVVNVRGRQDEVPPRRRGQPAPLDEEAPRHGAPLLLELGADLRQAARLVGAPHRPDQEGVPRPGPRRLHHGGLRQRHGAVALADAREGLPGRGGRRVRVESLLSPHGPPGHGIEHRQGPAAHLRRHAGRQGSGEGPGLGEAHPLDDRHRRRGPGGLPGRRRRDLLLQHVHFASPDRSRRRWNSR